MVIGCGNLGAPPHEPLTWSNAPTRAAFTVVNRSASMTGPLPGATVRDCSTSADTSRWPAAITSLRCPRHAWATPSRTWRNDGIPWRG